MIITKILETSIDLCDPDDIYVLDAKALLFKKLNERYQNKCFASLLILNVVEIVRYSNFIMVTDRLTGSAYVDVMFKVEGIILTKGEVLQGCKVINVTASGIIINHQYAIGMLTQDKYKKAFSIIKKDQLVPVIVEEATYNVGKAQITISCKPYTPQPYSNIIYNVTNIISPADTEKLDLILNNISIEEKLHEPLKKLESYTFFKNLMYPFKTVQKFNLSPAGESFKPVSLTLKDILEIRDGSITNADITVDNYLMHSKKIFTASTAEKVLDSPMYSAISSILQERLLYMRTLREFSEYYNTAEKTQEMLAYWKICMSVKE
jgi:DNA-directed RNA polymerase subunit E'/Rpb7